MKVLWLARALPLPAISADRIFTLEMAKSLASAGAEVTFIGLQSEERDPEAFQKVASNIRWIPVAAEPRSLVRGLFSLMPVVAARHAVPAFKAALEKLLTDERFDAIVLDQHASGWVLDAIDERLLRGSGTVLVHYSHDFETEVTAAIARNFKGNFLKKAALYLNGVKTGRVEKRLAQACDFVIVQTEQDKLAFQHVGPRSPPLVCRAGHEGTRRSERQLGPETPREVLILGTFVWTAKQMNLEEFLVEADGPLADAGIVLNIIGSAEHIKKKWEGKLRATRFLGFVDDLDAAFMKSRMGLVIERTGGGFKKKTLDYIFQRLPVAGIRAGFTGIEDDLLANFIVAEDAADLTRKIIAHIDDFAHLNQVQEAAFSIAAKTFNWSESGQKLYARIEDTRSQAARSKP